MAEPRTIYLDNAASTPCDPRVVEAMLPYFTETYGNPASGHAIGLAARAAVDEARGHAAALIGATPGEIVWTAGASEADNLAIKGVARAFGRGHVITSAVEHKAVLQPCRRLEREGFDVTYVTSGADGVVTADHVRAALRADTVLVSIIWVNNEIGAISAIAEIGALCRERGILFHSDATQAIGAIPLDVRAAHVDLMSFSGHKMCGPKGAGALFVRADPPIDLQPVIEGGGHEGGRRAGTLNVPGIVGLGTACRLCREEIDGAGRHLAGLRDRLEAGLMSRVDGVVVNGSTTHRAPHIANLSFTSAAGTPLAGRVERVACSAGAAISSAGAKPSHVLEAIGVPPELAVTALRFSVGRFTTEQDVDDATAYLADVIGEAIGKRATTGRT